ncbi:hypothetical protein [Nakamurella lactea]|uniref:hypothetical protein n=1 Tax=Nakamurella lactea TaxID=459515 RepID=UPI000410C0CD|nr:hypothetical protein [Nakamurella lactea]
MLTEFSRDAVFTVAWFGLMTMVWFGWAQEDPPPRWRIWLGIGSVIGTAIAIGFGVATAANWDSPSALQGRYQWFGVLVAAEVLLAGGGCAWLAKTHRQRWMAWWVGLVVAVHFLPLAWLLDDASIAVIGALELVILVGLHRRLRSDTRTTSAQVGAAMGTSLLAYAVIAGLTVVATG